jgi:hypothetical protein
MSTLVSAVEAQENGYIVGLRTGKVEPRLEIDEFILDKDVLNLFLLALIHLQHDRHHREPWSWYQICGEFAAKNWLTSGPNLVENPDRLQVSMDGLLRTGTTCVGNMLILRDETYQYKLATVHIQV